MKITFTKLAYGTSAAIRDTWQQHKVARVLMFLFIIPVIFFSCKKALTKEGLDVGQANAGNLKTNTTTPADFMVVALPDTQYYTDTLGINGHGPAYLNINGTDTMFQKQIDWIKLHRVDSNIVYVAGLGDVVDHGDDTVAHPHEWKKASKIIYGLETPYTGYANGIPYGLAVGNHDQTPNGQPLTGTTTKYNSYFGTSHFSTHGYYGSNYGSNNDSHYDFFSVDGVGFIVIYIEYDDLSTDPNYTGDAAVNTWAYNTLGSYASRKAIIVTHSLMGNAIVNNKPQFSDQGLRIYNRLKSRPNVFMMLGGHFPSGGTERQDTYNGATIRSMLSDYQGRDDGGGGFMRLIKVSYAKDLVSVKSYSPYKTFKGLTDYFTDPASQFTRPLFHQETAMRTCDFNRDGKTELGFFNAGTWKINGMSNYTNGVSGDIQAPGDYNGDGKADFCFYRPSDHTWYADGVVPNQSYGNSTGDIPVAADYDGDGKTDFAVWRTSTFEWFVYPAATGVAYGAAGDIPVPGDYDGDGKVDFATFRPSNHTWYIRNQTSQNYGLDGDVTVPGDYNGDGKTDIAQFRTSTGVWYILNISNSVVCVTPAAGDIPAPGDYDGLGQTQPAVYRPSTHTLYVYHWSTSTITTVNFSGSASGDKILNLPVAIRRIYFP